MFRPAFDKPYSRLAGATIAALAVSTTVLTTAAYAATTPHIIYAGGGYASTVSIGSGLRSGHSSVSGLCTSRAGSSMTNSAAALTLTGLGTIGAATTTTRSLLNGDGNPESLVTTATGATTLLSGLIHADAIASSASLTSTPSGFVGAGTTTLTNLTVAGQPITGTPRRNSSIAIDGVGKLILNHQVATTTLGAHNYTTDALKLILTAGNSAGLPAGAVIIGVATAGLHEPVYHQAFGNAYATSVQLGSVFSSGKTSVVAEQCGGSDGTTNTNTLASLSVPTALDTGTLSTTATSVDGAASTSSITTATIASANLLAGVVSADAVHTVASAVRSDSGVDTSGSGTTFTGLSVDGQPVSGAITVNRVIDLAVGTLTLNGVTTDKDGATAFGIRLVLSKPVGSLAAGTTITVGASRAGVIA